MTHFSKIAVILAIASPAIARPDGVGGHHGHHGGGHHTDHASAAAPSASGPAPASGYVDPSTSYAATSPGSAYSSSAVGAYPSTGYEAGTATGPSGYPDSGYVDPGTGYGSSTSVASDAGFDASMLIIPILIIAGLALLFPSVRVVDGGRRKREAGGDSTSNLVERVQDIYMAVMESEECMERIACEVGGIAADAGINKGMIKMAQSFVPKKYSKMMKNFNSAKDCHKIKCGAF